MKKFAFFSLLATMAFGMVSAQTEEKKEIPANGAKIRFESLEHNYGNISKGSPGTCTFTFYNDGNEPLILQNVKASCGCTTPSWTQKPVMPGQSGTIDVKYNTNNVGAINKSITVTSNAVDNPRVQLKIKGNVSQPQSDKVESVQPAKEKEKPAAKEAREDSSITGPVKK